MRILPSIKKAKLTKTKMTSILVIFLVINYSLNIFSFGTIEQNGFLCYRNYEHNYGNHSLTRIYGEANQDLSNVESSYKSKTRIMVRLNDEKIDGYYEVRRIIENCEGQIVGNISIENRVKVVVVELPELAVSDFTRNVYTIGLAAYVEPSIKMQAQLVPNDPYWNVQWALNKIQADWAWNTTVGNSDTLVALIDSGVDWHHPDLTNYAALGYDWVNNDPDPMDDCGHGTECAGIIAAGLNNSVGIAGLAQVRIMAEKVLNVNGEGFSDYVANGIIHAVEQGADIISMSFGSYEKSEVVYEAIKYAYNNGILLIAASGNDHIDTKFYPAAYDEVIAVAATDQNDDVADFSNFGEWIELSAPGVNICSTFLNGGYEDSNGTSMACPHVTGVAALLMSIFPNETSSRIRMLLQYTVDDLGVQGRDIYYGYGRINAKKALQLVSAKHELSLLRWMIPPYLELNSTNVITAEIFNFGRSNETNVSIFLISNNTQVWNDTLNFIPSNSSIIINVEWMPLVQGVYNMSLYVNPVFDEENTENNVLMEYVYAGIPIKAVVLSPNRNVETEAVINWEFLNTQWKQFGDQMIYIDYVSLLNKDEITYEDIASTEANVLIISSATDPKCGWEFKSFEIDAIERYVREGNGLIVIGNSFGKETPNNLELARLVGLKTNISLRYDVRTDLLQIMNTSNPIFEKIPNPLVFPHVRTAIPYDEQWDTGELAYGNYVASGYYGESVIVEYNGLLYVSACLEMIPPRYYHHLQLIYNAITWSKFQRSKHELEISLRCPDHLNPTETTLLNVTASNIGLMNELNVKLYLSIDGRIVDSEDITELEAGSSFTISYPWSPRKEGEYNISAYISPVPDEGELSDNFRSKTVFAHFPRFILWDIAHRERGFLELGKYNYIHNLLRANGFIVNKLKAEQVNSETLAGYDLFVLFAPNKDILQEEAEAITNWVDQGGSLLVIADVGFTSMLRAVTRAYGVQIYRHWVGEGTATHIVNHSITQGVRSIYHTSAVHIEAEYPSHILAWASLGSNTINLLSATHDHRVVVITDSYIFSDGGIKRSDNERLVLNLFHWLAFNPLPEHDLIVSLESPIFVQKGESSVLNVTISNHGSEIENQILVSLLVNGTLFSSRSFPQLVPGIICTFNFLWTPNTSGNFNITAHVPPVPGEKLVRNNFDMQEVSVAFYERSYFPNKWIEAGDAMKWHADNGCWFYNLPFSFPFYGIYYDSVYISSNGLITFTESDLSYGSSIEALSEKLAITPAWNDWSTSNSFDVYSWQPDAKRITFRWNVGDKEGNVANFAVTLSENGAIQFNYGFSNCSVRVVTGISNGKGHLIAEYVTNLNNIHTIVFSPFELEHELAVHIDMPEFVVPKSSVAINAMVFNHGLVDEKNIGLELAVNGSIVYSLIIMSLSRGSIYQYVWSWTPVMEGKYLVSARVSPVAGEIYIDNNIEIETVFVLANAVTSVVVHPQSIIVSKDEVFTVDVMVDNVENLHAWQVKLYFNSTVLNCTNIWVPIDNVFAGKNYIAPESVIESNFIFSGATLFGGETPFVGNGVLCRIQFKAKNVGKSVLSFDSENTILLAPSLQPLNFDLIHGEARVEASAFHDVAIIDVRPAMHEAYSDWIIDIIVVVSNEGNVAENFDVKLFCDVIPLGTKMVVNLLPAENASVEFTLDAGKLRLYTDYLIWAEADTILTEDADLEDNVLCDGFLVVRLAGDTNGDSLVNISDFALLGKAFGSSPSQPNWRQNADLNRDEVINLTDLYILWSQWRNSNI